jgi:hypothetical protein
VSAVSEDGGVFGWLKEKRDEVGHCPGQLLYYTLSTLFHHAFCSSRFSPAFPFPSKFEQKKLRSCMDIWGKYAATCVHVQQIAALKGETKRNEECRTARSNSMAAWSRCILWIICQFHFLQNFAAELVMFDCRRKE